MALSPKPSAWFVLVFAAPLATAQNPGLTPTSAFSLAHRWSDPRTWPGGVLPVAGDCVTIPPGKRVVLDTSPPPLAGLDIAGILAFDEEGDRELRADWIRVSGVLQIGTSHHPFARRATITLADDFAGSCSAAASDRTLAVEGAGALRIHGAQRGPTWTKLAATVQPGATQLVFATDVEWQAGDRIVLAPTGFDLDESETCTVVSVQGNVVEIDPPAEYVHWGEIEGAQYDGVGVDERGEVGLLTRDVVIQGDPLALPSGEMLGGQTRFHLNVPGRMRIAIDWCEFRYLGDEGVLGHYPIHFHELGDLSGAYLRSCSLHSCFNRWVAIHGSQGIELAANVGFETVGHGFYFEDPEARGCTLRENLGLCVRPPPGGGAGLHHDDEPAVFWLDHPDNTIEGNVAAGSHSFGFWFDTKDGEPTPWTNFTGNVAHSSGDSGFFLNGRPRPSAVTAWRHCTAYKNRRYGYWLRTLEQAELEDCDAADNRAGFYLASSGFQRDELDRDGVASLLLHASLVIGESHNVTSLPQQFPNPNCHGYPRWDALAGVELYDGRTRIEDCTFASFADRLIPDGFTRKGAALTQTWYSSPWAVDPCNSFAGLTFVQDASTTTVPLWLRTATGLFTKCNGTIKADNGIASTIVVDRDGTLSGIPEAYLAPNNPFLVGGVPATYVPEWNAHVVDPSTAHFGQLELDMLVPQALADQLSLLGVVLPNVSARFVQLASQTRAVAMQIAGPRDPINSVGGPAVFQPRYPTNVLAGDVYAYAYDPSVLPSDWGRYFALTFQDTAPGDFVVAAVPLLAPSPTGALVVTIDGLDASATPSIDFNDLLAASGDAWWYDASAEQMWLRIRLESVSGGTTIFDGASTTVTVLSY